MLRRHYTVENYSNEKGLPADRLRSRVGITEQKLYGSLCVIIPYFDYDRKLQRYRVRNWDKRWWNDDPDGDSPIIPYGIWYLSDTDPVIYLCEGESDCQTLWLHGFNALGIPGANMFKVDWTKYLLGYDTVVICGDNDEAGKRFADDIVNKISEFRLIGDSIHKYDGEIKVINLPPGAKDVNELLTKRAVRNAG